MSNLKFKYEKLAAKVMSSSFDYERGTIYVFQKYCKHCGSGLIKPHSWDPKEDKKLWKKSFCSDECQEIGPRFFQAISVKPSETYHRRDYPIEEMAFIALEIQKEEKNEIPLIALVRKTNEAFKLLSEKMRFMEIETQEKWYPSKWFYWLSRA